MRPRRNLPLTAGPVDRRRFMQGMAAAGGLLLGGRPLRQVLAAGSQSYADQHHRPADGGDRGQRLGSGADLALARG